MSRSSQACKSNNNKNRMHCGFGTCAFVLIFAWPLMVGAITNANPNTSGKTDSNTTNNNNNNNNSSNNIPTNTSINTRNTNAVLVAYNNNPHFRPNRWTIVHLFEWKFVDIGTECERFLGPQGYAGVQLSPVTEHLVVHTQQLMRPWWERYHPISYKIATRSGTEAEFLAMSRACNAAGVRIYVDVVLNHMAVGLSPSTLTEPLTGTAGSQGFASNGSYPGVPYTSEDFHVACLVQNYSNAQEVRNCQLDGRPDLDHTRADVRQRVVELLNKLVDLGAAGFRVHAAKYMWPADLKQIFSEVKHLNSAEFDFPKDARPFVYQDVVDLGMDAISKTEYSSYGVVTEHLYAAELAIILSGKVPLSSLINWGPAMGFLPHQEALVFVDSHDGQRGLRELGSLQLVTHQQRRKYVIANAFMLAHPYGRIKQIMSSYRYSPDDFDQGPPVESDMDYKNIRSPEFEGNAQCTVNSGWVCEHRWPSIANMIALVNSLSAKEDSVVNFQTDGPNHIAFCRGEKAFIAINNDAELEYAAEVHTCLKAGVYCDVISGGRTEGGNDCRGQRVVVDANGKAKIQLAVVKEEFEMTANDASAGTGGEFGFGVIAIYVDSRLMDDTGRAAGTTEATNVKQRDPVIAEPVAAAGIDDDVAVVVEKIENDVERVTNAATAAE